MGTKKDVGMDEKKVERNKRWRKEREAGREEMRSQTGIYSREG